MKIAMLSRSAARYGQVRLMEAAQSRGHHLDTLNPFNCYLSLTDDGPQILYEGEALAGYDAVIPLFSPATAEYGMAVLRQFESAGVLSVNPSTAMSQARDKLQALQLLAGGGVRVPDTAFAYRMERADELMDIVGGAPAIVKLLGGRQGVGVVLAQTLQSARSTIEAFRFIDQHVLVQRFIEEAEGSDIRVIVIDGEVVAAMKRTGPPGEFRSNLHRGGNPEPVEITAQERELAIDATRSVGLNVCGVDILRGRDGPMVIEVNATPGLRGAESVSGQDIAGKIIDFLALRVAQSRARRPRPHLVHAINDMHGQRFAFG
ncbi:MAG: RimK family alpha-L-glutamate ligase [Devosia sp.]